MEMARSLKRKVFGPHIGPSDDDANYKRTDIDEFVIALDSVEERYNYYYRPVEPSRKHNFSVERPLHFESQDYVPRSPVRMTPLSSLLSRSEIASRMRQETTLFQEVSSS